MDPLVCEPIRLIGPGRTSREITKERWILMQTVVAQVPYS
jgi:hypothetical protein